MQATDLKDGLRFLLLDNGKFHPARLNSTDFDGIFNVALVKQRHNRPEIMARDDILAKGVSFLKPNYILESILNGLFFSFIDT